MIVDKEKYNPTKAEIEIVQWMAEDLRPIDIAKEREKSVSTIETQIFNLRKKAGIKTIGGLVAWFYRNRLIK